MIILNGYMTECVKNDILRIFLIENYENIYTKLIFDTPYRMIEIEPVMGNLFVMHLLYLKAAKTNRN